MKNLNLLYVALFLMPLSLISQEVEEVIVTANKKAETLQEIPMNISVITETALEERGITNPEDYLRSLAGVSTCLLYTSPSPRDRQKSRMPSSA